MSPSEFDSLVSEIGEDYRLQVTELWELEKGEQRAEDDRRRLEGRLAENEARSQELEGRLAENEARSQELEGRLAENEARSRELEGRLAENEDYRRRLESQLAEKDAWSRELVNRLESVLTSRSWTVTEPLRTLSRYLRKMTGTR